MAVNRARRAGREPVAPDVGRGRGTPWLAWAGAIGAALGSLVQQQGLGNALRFDCSIDAPAWGIATGIAALAVIAIGALLSAREFRLHNRERNEHSTRRFIASLSLMASALAAGLVVFMTMAALIVPPCPP